MKQFFLIAFVCLCTLQSSYAQNGWTRGKNKFYAQSVATTFNTPVYYNVFGDKLDNGASLHSHALLLYGEYGILDRLDVILDFPAIRVNYFSTTEPVAGPGSVKLGLKYRFFKSFPFALQVDFDIPTDDGVKISDGKEPGIGGLPFSINLPTSDGEFNIWTTLAASQSTKSGNTFGSLYCAANWRTKGYSHQFQIGLEVGHLFFNRWYLIGKFKIQEQLNDGDAAPSIFYGEGTTFSEYNITNIIKLNEHWSVIGGAADFIGFPVRKRNLYDGFTFFAGVAVKY